jgi:hypothetical protein
MIPSDYEHRLAERRFMFESTFTMALVELGEPFHIALLRANMVLLDYDKQTLQ